MEIISNIKDILHHKSDYARVSKQNISCCKLISTIYFPTVPV